MRNTKLIVFAVLLLSGSGVYAARSYFLNNESPVKVALVARGSINSYVFVSGNVINHNELAISSQVPGVVARLAVREGDRVHKGEVLAVLDDRETEIRLQKYAASLKTAEQNQSVYMTDLARLEAVLAVGGESQKTVDSARQRLVTSQAEAEQLRDDERLARLQLEKYTLRSPVDGVVTVSSSHVGTAISMGEVLFRLAPTGSREIEVKMDVVDSDVAKSGKTVVVSSDAYPGHEWQEKITWVAPAAIREGVHSNLIVRIGIIENSPVLILGQQVDVKIPGVTANNVIVVPSDAIIYNQNKPFVATIADGHVHLVPVGIAAADLKHTEIKSGIDIGQWIIEPEGKTLLEGEAVRVISKQAAK
jgi:RND family efflux transporter MFP subunit